MTQPEARCVPLYGPSVHVGQKYHEHKKHQALKSTLQKLRTLRNKKKKSRAEQAAVVVENGYHMKRLDEPTTTVFVHIEMEEKSGSSEHFLKVVYRNSWAFGLSCMLCLS